MDEHWTVVDGVRMRALAHGDGDVPVILVHGIPTNPLLWRHVMPRLRGARAFAWEMVGYGESIPEGEDRDISVAKQADYLGRWMREQGIDRAVLAGHDLGGGVAQILAVRHPERVAGLLLTNAIGYDSWPIRSVAATSALGDIAEHMPDAVFKQMISGFMKLGHDHGAMADEAFDTHWPPYERHGGATAFVRQTNALRTEDTLAVQDDLPTLRELPVRLVWGAADGFQPVEYGERFARDLDASLTRVESGKHFMPENHPDVIADALNDVVREATPLLHR